MTTYYIDYDSGLDSNNGTSTSSPWKHCPGDSNFTGSHTTVAGDTFIFKGGVVYRGSITVNASGTSGNEITYDGNSSGTWGTGKAIIDGSEIWNPTWTQCTSASECGGNSNYANIWWATAPVDFTVFVPLYEDGEFVWFSQSPFPSDPIIFNNILTYYEIPLNDENKSVSQTTIKDTTFFTQIDSNYWVGTYVLLWAQPNTIYQSQITNYDPENHTITFNAISGSVYTDRASYYSVLGHVGIINGSGQFGLSDGKIFIWPRNSNSPVNHIYSISKRKVAIEIHSQYQIIEGFTVRGFYGLESGWSDGKGIGVFNTSSYSIIRNNEFCYIRTGEKSAAISVDCSNILVTNNYIHHCQKNYGILCSRDSIYVIGNSVEHIGGTGILFMNTTNSCIAYNIVRNINGDHKNAVTVYENSNNILVAYNQITTGLGNNPYTLQNSSNIYTIGNLINALNGAASFVDWGGMTGVNYVLNNTIIRGGIYTGTSVDPFVFRNNIIDGGIADNREYNIYTSLSWDQEPRYGWSPATGEIVNTNVSTIFTNYSSDVFTLKENSPAINSGIDVSEYYPTTSFPNIDFTRDLTGKLRTNWDIGAYFYSAAGTKKCYGFVINGKYFFLTT